MERALGCNSAYLAELRMKSRKSARRCSREMNGKVSAALLWLLESGSYGFVVTEKRRNAICDYFEADQDKLFPFVGAKEEKAS